LKKGLGEVLGAGYHGPTLSDIFFLQNLQAGNLNYKFLSQPQKFCFFPKSI